MFLSSDLYRTLDQFASRIPDGTLEIMELLGKEEEADLILQTNRLRLGLGALLFTVGEGGVERLYRYHTYLFFPLLNDVGYLLIKNANRSGVPKDWSVHLEGSVLATYLIHELREAHLDGYKITQAMGSNLIKVFEPDPEVRRAASREVWRHIVKHSVDGEFSISPRPFEIRGVDVPKILRAAQSRS